MAQAVLGMSKKTPTKQIAKARAIAQSLVDNIAVYATPSPTVIVILKAATDFEKTYNDSRGKDKNLMDIFKAQKKLFTGTMNQVLSYVQQTSGGDPLNIEKAGMDFKKPPTPPQPLGKIKGLSGSQGRLSGETDLKWKPLKGRKSYFSEKSPDGITWADAKSPCTAAKVTVTGLVPESYSWFRVVGINQFGIGEWSDPIRVEAK